METITLNMRCGTWTEKGVRRKNEDSLEVERNMDLFMIADGMGGHPSGDLASQGAVQEALRALKDAPVPEHFLREAILLAHEELAQAGDNRGSTLTIALIVGTQLKVGHVGDCRLFVDGRQVTKDQGSGEMLHHFLGGGRVPEVALYDVPIRNGSWLLMTTDGVHDTIPILSEMPRLIMSTKGQPEEIARLLVNSALKSGSNDNCSCIVAQLTPHSESPTMT